MRKRLRKKQGLPPRGSLRKYAEVVEKYAMLSMSPKNMEIMNVLEENQRRLNNGINEMLPT